MLRSQRIPQEGVEPTREQEPELTLSRFSTKSTAKKPVTNRNESPHTDDPTDHLVPAASTTAECPMKVAHGQVAEIDGLDVGGPFRGTALSSAASVVLIAAVSAGFSISRSNTGRPR